MKNKKTTYGFEPGTVHGMLTITRTWTENKHCQRMVDCICKCGREKLNTRFRNIRDRKMKNCGCIKSSNALSTKTRVFNEVYCDYRTTAKKRSRIFQLTREQCEVLFEGNCHLCGNEPQKRKPRKALRHSWAYNGIDRIDSTKGYTIDNVASCCTVCNFLKSNTPHYEFLSHIKRIADYQYSKHGKIVC